VGNAGGDAGGAAGAGGGGGGSLVFTPSGTPLVAAGGGGGGTINGGGGSFVVAAGTTFASSVLTNRAPMDGAVTICATAIATAAVPALDPSGLLLLALLLSGFGVLAVKTSRLRFLARRR